MKFFLHLLSGECNISIATSLYESKLRIISLYYAPNLYLNNPFWHMFKKHETSIVPSIQCMTFSFLSIDSIALLPIFWYFFIPDNGINKVSNCFDTFQQLPFYQQFLKVQLLCQISFSLYCHTMLTVT